MKLKKTVKLTQKVMDFLDRLRTNRRKQDTDKRDSPNWKLMEIIYQDYRENDKNYKDLLKRKWNENG